MTITSLASNDYYYSSLNTNTKRSANPPDGNPMDKALDSLQSALEFGDTSSAQDILKEIMSHAPKANSSTSSTDSTSDSDTNPGDTITNYLKSIQTAMESGDTTTAQSTLSELKDYLTNNPPPPPPGGAAGGVGGAMSSNPFADALDSLGSALESGDTSSAQEILTDILSHVSKSDNTDDSVASATNDISDFLKSLQSAVESGDATSAASTISSMKEYLAQNPPPPPSFNTYSDNGTMSASSYSTFSRLA